MINKGYSSISVIFKQKNIRFGMILIMNKAGGVGCTTIAYNISRLFYLPLWVSKGSFLLDETGFNETHFSRNIEINELKGKIDFGVLDIGSRYVSGYKNDTMRKRCKNASVAVIPFELGYETILQTIETIRDVRTWNKNLPIVLILNKLDRNDDEIDFRTKSRMMEIFRENASDLIEFIGPTHFDHKEKRPILASFENTSKITLTYLRNSYGLSFGLEFGNYFLDNFKYKQKVIVNKSDDTNIVEDDENNFIENFEAQAQKLGNPFEFEFKFFRYLFFLTIKDDDYGDENIYIQEKDMVNFRQKAQRFLGEFSSNKLVFRDERFNKFKFDGRFFTKNKKLLKDLGFVMCAITTTFDRKGLKVEPFFDMDGLVFPENVQRLAFNNL